MITSDDNNYNYILQIHTTYNYYNYAYKEHYELQHPLGITFLERGGWGGNGGNGVTEVTILKNV